MDQPAAIVTGAGRGIGRATAEELARLGYRLTLMGRSEASLQETAGIIGGATVIVGDVARPEDVRRAVQQTLDAYGRIDALVNNAGYAPVRTIEQMTIETWREVMDTNLSAAFYFCKAVWPAFKRQNAGVIVNLSSAAARDPFAGLAAYGAAKAGLNLLGLALAREGEAIGVRIHTIAPSAVETEMFRGILSANQYPTEKTLLPAEVARVIGQCVTGELRHTSGEVIYLHKRL